MNNKPLYLFILEEIKKNSYYTNIRVFVSYHRLNIEEVAKSIYEKYLDNIDAWPPYKFLDLIEDYLGEDVIRQSEEYVNFELYDNIKDAIDDALENNMN